MAEYKQIIIDSINIATKTLSIAIDTLIDTSNGPVKIGRWRCAYTSDDSEKLENDLAIQAPDCDPQEVLNITQVMWDNVNVRV